MAQENKKNHEEIFEWLATQNRSDNIPASTHVLVILEMENVENSKEQQLKNDEHTSMAESIKIMGQDHTRAWAEPNMVISF